MTSSFAKWLCAPIHEAAQDSEFEVRRATIGNFPKIFELVNAVLRPRTRAEFYWLHESNPNGVARCWIVIERRSGKLVASESRFPWPVACGSERIEGAMCGFAVTLPRLQRRGLFQLRSKVRNSHPWHNRTISLGSNLNDKSRGALTKFGFAHSILGPLPKGVLLLNWKNHPRFHFLPRSVAGLLGGTLDAASTRWRNRSFAQPETVQFEAVSRFDSGVDFVAHRRTDEPTYWCPHDADFLNWRYFENPVHSYLAQVALVRDEVRGYFVIRVTEDRAILMEFAGSSMPEPMARAMLGAAVRAARGAGCKRIEFYATSSWSFWALFRQAGFRLGKSKMYMSARCPDRADASQEANWQLMPGDSDAF